MTIDEAIARTREIAKRNREQWKNCPADRRDIEHQTCEQCAEEIRGKAIDDFRAEIEKEYDNDYCPNVSDYLDYKISLRDLFNIAEQLKEGN